MPIATRTFRVFISSTFEDLKEERNVLQRDVFPALHKFCESHGARFQAIDLRWGVRDEASLDQQTMEICLREIERCQRTRIKPNFIVLLGDRYGWRPVRARIPATEFEAVVSGIKDASERALVEGWYQRDDNAVPPEYLLKPRTSEFVLQDRWRQVEEGLHRILCEAARAAGLSQEALVPYVASATHQEILKGLGTTEQDREHVFAFFRSPTGPREDPELSALENHLQEQLGDNVFHFTGGDTEELCRQVQHSLENVIRTQCQSFESRPALDLEIEAHGEFARDRARHFAGRESLLSAIASYISGDDRRALVLNGASGSGKSAIMAKASSQLAEAIPGAVNIRRFIGATPDSSSGVTLLRGLCQEIARSYGGREETPTDFNLVAGTFKERLALGTAERPLQVFIDALDQLGAQDPARGLTWLPAELPPHCRVVVSTIKVPETLRQARAVEVCVLPPQEAEEALAAWFQEARRTLQPDQRRRLLDYFGRCGLPLYLKLAFEEARLWRSFDGLEDCALADGLAGIIDVLFDRLSAEGNHGPVLLSRSLGYLTVARHGLTESEILNILTADDDVWGDFDRRKRHDPVGRRLPVIVWSRLALDLEPYLTERAVPGGTVVTFYHRQLPECIVARFLFGRARKLRHKKLAEHFAGQSNWLDADKSVPNLRRLTEIVCHQVSAGMLDEAEATLTDLAFLSAKCRGGLVFDSQEDYRIAIGALPEAQAVLQEEARRQVEAVRWIREIIEYSRQWTTGEGRPLLPKLIQSVRLWSNEEVQAEFRRIVEHATRLDRLQMFARFVEQECYPLLEFGVRQGFVVQHAFNHAPAGPVHEAAERLLAALNAPLLTRVWGAGAHYNPKPALLRTLEGHTEGVTSVSVTPDSRRAVSASLDKTVRVWDLGTGACLRVLEGHTDWVKGISVTPDGLRAVSGSQDRTVRVWDLETGACLQMLEGHTEAVESATVTPDGQRAVSASSDKTVRLWDLQTGACLRVLEGHGYGVPGVSVTPDGQRAVSADADKTVRVWDLGTGACLRVLKGHTDRVNGVSVTPDGRRAVSGSKDRTVQVWDLVTGSSLWVLEGHTDSVESVSVTPDSRCAVSASNDNSLVLWDLERKTGRVLVGHADSVESVSLTPDGQRAVSASADKTLRIWDLESGGCLRAPKGHTAWVWSVSVTSDNKRAISASNDKTLRVWDLKTGECLRVLEGHTNSVVSMGVTPDGQRSVSASFDKTVRVWDMGTGACLRVLEGHTDFVSNVSVTPDSRRAVSASFDKTVRVWDLETGACLWVLEGHMDWVMSIGVTPDGQRAVSASLDKTVRVWDLETGSCLWVLEGHTDGVGCISVMPDSRRAVSASVDQTLRVWNLETGSCLWVLEGHTGAAQSATVTPDGQRAVSASSDKTVRLWDLETGTCLLVLKGHTDWIEAVRLTPDGRRVVSVGMDRTLRVWDLETGACVAIAHVSSTRTAVALAPLLDRVIVGTSTGEVLQFDLRGMS